MSRTSLNETCVWVAVRDHEGYKTPRIVPVFITYTVDVDSNYGADADGRRGALRVEYDVLDIWIEAPDLKQLSAKEAAQALADARGDFERVDKHHLP